MIAPSRALDLLVHVGFSILIFQGEKMKCIYLQDKDQKSYCTIELPHFAKGNVWEIDDSTLKDFCVADGFLDCPRLKAYMEYLEKSQKK